MNQPAMPAHSGKGSMIAMSLALLVVGLITGYFIGKNINSDQIVYQTATPSAVISSSPTTQAQQQVSLKDISPSSGQAGTKVTITGTGFDSLHYLNGSTSSEDLDTVFISNGSFSANLWTTESIKTPTTLTVIIPKSLCPGDEALSCSSNFSKAIVPGEYFIYVKSGPEAKTSNKIKFTVL